MNDDNGYAVFFFPQALEALGDAVKPYLQDGAAGPHVVCRQVDTGGALIEMTLNGTAGDGRQVELELMVPSGMVRMIVSAQSDQVFGFGPHAVRAAMQQIAPVAEAPGTAGDHAPEPSPATVGTAAGETKHGAPESA